MLDSLVVHLEDTGGPASCSCSSCCAPGVELDDACARGSDALRDALSPRHVPDAIVAVPAIPRTLTGKKLELPVKRILLGTRPRRGRQPRGARRPDALDAFVDYAAARVGR